MKDNLLSDPIIRARLDDGERKLCLPEVYAALAADAVRAFPALRPHQRHAWHAFLCQLGAIALHWAGAERPPTSADAWRDLLRALTPTFEDDAPWRLVVADAARPAFLQPPAPESDLAAFKARIDAADTLDVLVTARNFEIKAAVAADAEDDDWTFALIDLQTMEGFLGAGNYGIARMNGGFSARPFLGLAPATCGVGAHVMRDIVAMLAARRRRMNEQEAGVPDYAEEGGHALLWLLPWDGGEQLRLDRLDPYFVEVCRRVRLGRENGRLFARTATSKAARIDASAMNGVMGDFWTPVNIAENKSFSLPDGGFSARRLMELLGDAYRLPPALEVTEAEAQAGDDWLLVARGLSRGQGKTEGWHERIVPLRPPTISAFRNRVEKERLGALAEELLKEISHIQWALGQGCAVFSSGGKRGFHEKRNEQNKLKSADFENGKPYQAKFNAEADARFFEMLQDRFEAPENADVRIGWAARLIRSAKRVLDQALKTLPCPAIQRQRARTRAERVFWRELRRSTGPFANDRDVVMAALGEKRDAA